MQETDNVVSLGWEPSRDSDYLDDIYLEKLLAASDTCLEGLPALLELSRRANVNRRTVPGVETGARNFLSTLCPSLPCDNENFAYVLLQVWSLYVSACKR